MSEQVEKTQEECHAEQRNADEAYANSPVAPQAEVEAPVKEEHKLNFAKGLIPGDGNPEDSSPDTWKPCGLADGVIYFDNVEVYDHEAPDAPKVVKAGKERQALRYLLGPKSLDSFPQGTPEHGRVCEAAERVMIKPGRLGICEPSFHFLVNRHPEIAKEAKSKGFPLNRKFLSCDAGRHANQPEHAKRWHVVKAEEGIWCVFYV